MLSEKFCELAEQGWSDVFPQERTLRRALEQSIGMLCCFGRRTISRAICAMGRHQQDWSADYKLFSRSRWAPDRLFEPVAKTYLQRYRVGPVCAALDDTKLKKTGKKIKTAFWQRDPMSPPFHLNCLIYG